MKLQGINMRRIQPRICPGWIFVLLFLMAQITVACSSPQDEINIRVMSFNIRAGNGDIDEIARTIREENPDIVALQEVDAHWSERSDFVDQPEYLGEALDMHYFLGEIYSFDSDNPDSPHRQFGLAFLSKEPFINQENHHVTRLSTQTSEPGLKSLPGFPEIVVEKEGVRFRILNTHLDYRADPAIRIMEVEEMMAIVEPVDGPLILMGDLNAQPDAEELRPLFNILKDAWHQNGKGGYTYPANQPERRIDYILHSDHFEVKQVYIPDTEASDHRPVVADLVLTRDRR